MLRKLYQKHRTAVNKFDAVLLNHPVLERGLVIAPVIVAANSLRNALSLGVAFAVITFFTIAISYFIPKSIPYTIRVIGNAMIASLIFIPGAMLVEQMLPGSTQNLGIYLPLLATNSLIIQKSESRFHKMKYPTMLLQLLCNAAGFFLVVTVVGGIRELLGSGTLMGAAVPGITFKAPAFLFPFMGFILVGFLAAGVKKLVFFLNSKPREKRRRRKSFAEPAFEASTDTTGGAADE